MRYYFKTILITAVFIFSHSCQSPSANTVKQMVYEGVDQMVDEAISTVKSITVEEFKKLVDAQDMYYLIDVRTEAEHDLGYIPGTINIPRGLLEFWIEKEAFWEDEGLYAPLKEDKLIVYCKSGRRSALSVQTLEKMGFTEVYSLEGGFNDWKSKYPEDVQDNQPAVTLPQGAAVAAPESAGGC